MKKWIEIFALSFFSNKLSKDSIKKGFTSVFLSLILALVLLCTGVIVSDVLPFSAHYKDATGFNATVRNAFAGSNLQERVCILVENGKIKAKTDGDYANALIINTFDVQQDKDKYAINDYHLVVDTRLADTLAEVEAYCVSTDGQGQTITYEEYLTLNEVARLNFEFKLKYTGNQLHLDDVKVSEYKSFINGTTQQNRQLVSELTDKLSNAEITKDSFNRQIYELYFTNYYPAITNYESTSKVPLLRNYYFHQIIDKGEEKFLMIFDDCLVGSFKTDKGIDVFFYGFYNSLADGELIKTSDDLARRQTLIDSFIINSFKETLELNAYVHIMNTIRLVPIIVLMEVVIAMLVSSILSLKDVETCRTFGSAIKVVGSYAWFSALITAMVTGVVSFFVQRNSITIVSLVVFFITILIRSAIFGVDQIKQRKIQLDELSKEDGEQDILETEA